ncbi:MAG: hypothetical protein WD771_00865 [Gemmatimonadaceae bacterium]
MPDRFATAIDLICFTVVGGALAVLGAGAGRGGRSALPWRLLGAGEGLDTVAARLARTTLGRAPGWRTQLGASSDTSRHPSLAPLSVGYVAVVPAGTDAPPGHLWHRLPAAGAFGTRQQRGMVAAIATLRDRMDVEPIAFRLLPAAFTLGELQALYELLLGRRLHKASFRRALQGAFLVEPLEEWRTEGRGRPAQLYRYAPRRQRGSRPVRFALLA